MRFSGIKIGFAMTGSHCTIADVLPYMQLLIDEGAKVVPILSPAVVNTDTRFGKADALLQTLSAMTGAAPLTTLVEVEPVGPKGLFDAVLVAPCTGNTMAKLALAVTDTAVTLACKSQLRNNRPVVLAIATNDALSGNARNLGTLLNRKNIYFVPFGQDAPTVKENSIVAKMSLIPETILAALDGRQLQPVLTGI
ncbi:MAG TPA: dipicolinate synthase subunit B [Bacillota bacterium]|nr:dipicolinate synthase subunit B [Bacillota bacterium]